MDIVTIDARQTSLFNRFVPGIRSRIFLLFTLFAVQGIPARANTPAPVDEAINAAAHGDASWLLDWIANGGDPNQANSQGWTPLLIASARGRAAAVEVLLKNPTRKADPGVRFAPSGALPIHLAGQSGDVPTARALLAARPSDINEVWMLNGHTLLLQAAFYGHLDLAQFALAQGANPAATTLRGLTAIDFARQFDNRQLIEALTPSAPTAKAKETSFKVLLERVREAVPPNEEKAQRLSDAAAVAISDALQKVGDSPEKLDALTGSVLAKLEGIDPNRLAGDLRQPLLVVVVTGNNSGQHPEAAAELRLRIARSLLDHGASPLTKERHPMGAHAIIRASVFGHLDILRLMGTRITASELAGALNEIPVVNGLTALHDAVLRAGTAPDEKLPRYLEQIRWEIASGAHTNVEDFSGRTQRKYAEDIVDAARSKIVLEALDSVLPMPQWNHPAIAVPALEAAMKWYSDIFGFVPLGAPVVNNPATGDHWKIATSIFGGDISEVRLVRMRSPEGPYKQVLELFEIRPTPPPPPPGKRKSGYVHACMILGDPATTAGRIAATGGKILSESELPGVKVIFCEDPYGNVIELASAPW